MIRSLPKSTYFDWMKKTMWFGLVAYSALTSVLLVRMDPKPIVIGIDPYGTRLIGAEKDPILKTERDNFLKRFLVYLYNYDETNFDERISWVGDLMEVKLWESKKAEFLSISTRIKSEPLSSKAKIKDLREIDEHHFQADIEVQVESRLRKTAIQLRVNIEIAQAARTITKPYPWEIVSYDEQTAQ